MIIATLFCVTVKPVLKGTSIANYCPFVLFILAIMLSFLLRFTDSDYPFGIFTVFYFVYIVVCPFVFFILAIVLSVFLRFTASDYSSGIFKLFLYTCSHYKYNWNTAYLMLQNNQQLKIACWCVTVLKYQMFLQISWGDPCKYGLMYLVYIYVNWAY